MCDEYLSRSNIAKYKCRNIYLYWSPWDPVTDCILATSPAAACSRPSSRALGWWERHTAWLRHAWRRQTCDGSQSAHKARTRYCSVGSSPPLTAAVRKTTSKSSPLKAVFRIMLLWWLSLTVQNDVVLSLFSHSPSEGVIDSLCST